MLTIMISFIRHLNLKNILAVYLVCISLPVVGSDEKTEPLPVIESLVDAPYTLTQVRQFENNPSYIVGQGSCFLVCQK